MKAVGVRELKAHLSRYLRDVQAGETVLVTDRGRVIAELRAAPEGAARESEVDRGLRLLGARAALTVRESHDPGAYTASPLHAPAGTAASLLDAERGER
jgi:antitoxin (DNA-binding transcriptional repressor) of toxin-antitoxin stability system